MWTLHKQQQQRGVQLRARKSGEAPAIAVKDREAQDHEQAGVGAPGATYPASPIERGGDNVPTAPGPSDRDAKATLSGRTKEDRAEFDALPLPEGK
ncbi:hypothetical protein [Altererythrobacter sp. Root672]|uniref:hypothetical protein n=1 Tax=Altererythrobacter sp. Root672 TaxID=1736584 RepID=UPI0006FC1DAC|nr:hypothetical protein [Altererythrobacter sp. Root672]KRA80463.1 hypothetical protein ASD76_14940 [Altererythrobacter sp. Root672]